MQAGNHNIAVRQMSALTGFGVSRLLLPALTILFLLTVQALHFHDHAYRQDEAWDVHYALQSARAVGLPAHVAQVLYQLPPPNFLQDIWLHLFGHAERIVRWLSTLTTALTLAMFWRLTADLYGRRTGWLALTLLGSYSLFAFYTHEARPYAALAFGAVGLPFALLRFLRMPGRGRGALLAVVAVVPAFIHPYLAYVYIAQLLCAAVFMRVDIRRQRREIAFVLLLGVIVAYRVWLNFSGHSGSISHNLRADWHSMQALYDHLRFRPESLGLFLLAGGAVMALRKLFSRADSHTPTQDRMRFPAAWREGWILLSLMLSLGLPLLVNLFVPSVTPRHFLIAAPFLILLAALSLRALPMTMQLLAVAFFCVPFVAQFRYHSSNAGYWELAQHLERHSEPRRDAFAVMAGQMWENIGVNYYLQERSSLGLGMGDIFHFSGQAPSAAASAPIRFDESMLEARWLPPESVILPAYVADSERLWLTLGNGYPAGDAYLEAIEDAFTLYSAVRFRGETYYRGLELREYRRHPPEAPPVLRFGQDIVLKAWRLNDDHIVQPCQTISVDAWWTVMRGLDTMYSTTLVIAGTDGQGIVNADAVPGGITPTQLWQPGQIYFDERELRLPCDLPAGEYPLLLGMYETASAPLRTLHAHSADGVDTGESLHYLTTLVVEG